MDEKLGHRYITEIYWFFNQREELIGIEYLYNYEEGRDSIDELIGIDGRKGRNETWVLNNYNCFTNIGDNFLDTRTIERFLNYSPNKFFGDPEISYFYESE